MAQGEVYHGRERGVAMATATLVPLEEYLRTTYRPDRDWVDGETKERNMGEGPHASVQGFLAFFFRVNGSAWNVRAFPEQRVQTSARHYRIADVCVVLKSVPFEPIVRTPPLLCIEILSRGDSMSEMHERVEDYLAMGVTTVWVIDPRRRKAYSTDAQGTTQPVLDELLVPGTAIRVLIPAIFEELNEMEGVS
jgi:Uma2 family endonuclease